MATPTWLKKPKHRKTVVATNRGWEVEDTGELLVSVRNMDQKLKDYLGGTVELDGTPVEPVVQDTKQLVEPVVQDTKQLVEPETVGSVVDLEPTIVEPVVTLDTQVVVQEEIVEPVEEAPKKKRGPKPKNA